MIAIIVNKFEISIKSVKVTISNIPYPNIQHIVSFSWLLNATTNIYDTCYVCSPQIESVSYIRLECLSGRSKYQW
jgi:hypothetical protein